MRHYVFGYGSLICSESRTITAEALGGGDSDCAAIPVRLLNWVRLWNVRGKNTYLGVQCLEQPTSGRSIGSTITSSTSTNTGCSQVPFSCVGVLFPLPSSSDDYDETLKALDKREFAYTRQRVNLGLIQTVEDLLVDEERGAQNTTGAAANDSESSTIVDHQEQKENIYENYYKDTFLWNKSPSKDATITTVGTKDDATEIEVCVWAYVPIKQAVGIARTKNPILQSYVDVCIKGCLSISKPFAKEFVEGTYGWFPGDSLRCKRITTDEEDETWADSCSSCWINDRKDPKYSRANKNYTLEQIDALDAVFDPVLLKRRFVA